MSQGVPEERVSLGGHLRQFAPVKPEVESDDPFVAVAVQLPSIPGFDAMGEMTRCMIEEYAMMGFSSEMLMKMFKNPFYQAVHRVYASRGEAYVRELLDSVFHRSEESGGPHPKEPATSACPDHVEDNRPSPGAPDA